MRARFLPLALLLASPAAVAVAAAAGGDAGRPLEAKLERLEGGKLRLSELRGRPVLLELWATWCLPCQEQAGILEELESELTERGITVLAVDVGEPPKVVRDFLVERPKRYPVLLDRAQLLPQLLDIGELPVLALLDHDGRVAAVHTGVAQRDEVLGLLAPLATPPPAD